MLLIICLYIIFVGTNKYSSLEYQKSYDEVAHSFSTDYDKENPLTRLEGRERLLDLLIEFAEKETD